MIQINKRTDINNNTYYHTYYNKSYVGEIIKLDDNKFYFQFATEATCWDAKTLLAISNKLNKLNKTK
jgi:hypothetical protein